MQARRAARELALILFSQFDKKITEYTSTDIDEMLLKSVRILTNNSSESLQLTLGKLMEMKEYVDEVETEHPENLSRPIEVSNIPVPLTSDFSGRIEEMLNIAENALLALEIAEMATLECQSEVKEYIKKIADRYKVYNEEIDATIQECSKGWDISRMVRIDKDILRIAITEMVYIKEAPMKVVIDEAVELAKKYSTEDSPSFVNGILAKVVRKEELK